MFHIGLAKTGTSTIQQTMAANLDELRARGIVYPVLNGRKRQVAHHVLRQALYDGSGLDAPAWKALRGLRAEARDGTVLLSSEALSEADPRSIRTGIAGNDARAIVYLRGYPDWVVSAYAQSAKWGDTSLSFDDYLAGGADGRIDGIADRLLDWAEVFGPDRIRVRSIEPGNLVAGQVIDDVLSALGTTREGLEVPANVNETPDWRVVELLKERHAQDALRIGADSGAVTQARKRAFAAGLEAGKRLGWNERAVYLTRDQRQALVELYRTHAERLRTALPDCRIVDLASDFGPERSFQPSPEAISAGDRRAFEAVFSELLAEALETEGARRKEREAGTVPLEPEQMRVVPARAAGRLRGVVRKVWPGG